VATTLLGIAHFDGSMRRGIVAIWQLLRLPPNIKGLTQALTLFPDRMIFMRSS
jgi:hypothetical protein